MSLNVGNRIDRFIGKHKHQDDGRPMSPKKERVFKYLDILILTIKSYFNNKIGPQAAALSFFTILASIPFIAITLAMMGTLGLSAMIKDLLYTHFEKNQDAINKILELADNVVNTAQEGLTGVISIVLLLWIIFRLMANVESSFNGIWDISHKRSTIRRFSYYLIILIIAPLIIAVLFTGSLLYSNILEYVGFDIGQFGVIKTILTWVLFTAFTALTFFAMYKFIPNHEVNSKYAFRAALTAAVVFVIVQFFYLETQVFVTRWNGILGTFAAVPLFMIWMNVSWNIILFGAELSHAYHRIEKCKNEQ